jgi:hypothetical protein
MTVQPGNYTFGGVWTPDVALVVEEEAISGMFWYDCTVSIEGLDPQRAPSREEQLAGILALNPPRAEATNEGDLVLLMIRAAQVAHAETPGLDNSAEQMARIAYAVSRAVLGALHEAGADV